MEELNSEEKMLNAVDEAINIFMEELQYVTSAADHTKGFLALKKKVDTYFEEHVQLLATELRQMHDEL